MKNKKNLFYFLICFVEYLSLFAIECAVLEFLAPLMFVGSVPLMLYTILLIVVNPIIIWFTAETLLEKLGKDLEMK